MNVIVLAFFLKKLMADEYSLLIIGCPPTQPGWCFNNWGVNPIRVKKKELWAGGAPRRPRNSPGLPFYPYNPTLPWLLFCGGAIAPPHPPGCWWYIKVIFKKIVVVGGVNQQGEK